MANQTISQLKKQHNISDNTLKNIQTKAEHNIKMDTPTAGKQAVYDAYQQHYTNAVKQKAKDGVSLTNSNPWKDNIYQQTRLSLNPNDKAYYNTDNVMLRQTSQSGEQMARYQRMIESNSQKQLESAEAGYAKIRDQQITDLQNQLDAEVANGNLSVKQAEQQFEQQKEAIYAQNYLDSEFTKAQAESRGIGNSQQLLGMEQTRQANTTSLLNSNMSDRDMKVFEINNRLNQIKSQTARNISQVNADYGYNVTGAQAEILANQGQQQLAMNLDEYNRLQNMQFSLDQQGLQQRYTQENMAREQQYTLAQMSQSQKYTLEQFAVQQGYDLAKMSVQQQYTLAQMAQQYGYDMGLQKNQQAFQAGQNSLDRGLQWNMQQSQQGFQAGQNALDRNFQSGQNALDRNHDSSMAQLNSKLNMSEEQTLYNRQVQRENNAYNNPSSTEYKLRTSQERAGIGTAQTQTMLNLMTDVQINSLSKRMESLPKLSANPKQTEINTYNKQVDSINQYIKQAFPQMYDQFKVPRYSK